MLVNGQPSGTTPVTVKMGRKGTVVVEARRDGYAPASLDVPRRPSKWLNANFISLNPMAAQGMDSTSQWLATAMAWFTGVMSLDVATGGAWVRPDTVSIPLTPLMPPARTGGPPAPVP